MKIWGGTVKSYLINLFKYIPIFSQNFPVSCGVCGLLLPGCAGTARPQPCSWPLSCPGHDAAGAAGGPLAHFFGVPWEAAAGGLGVPTVRLQ